MARALNLSMDRTGRVLADRFHAHILKTPTEVGRARRYVLENAAIHAGRAGPGPSETGGLTSVLMTDCASSPRTWLLAHGWRRARLPKLSRAESISAWTSTLGRHRPAPLIRVSNVPSGRVAGDTDESVGCLRAGTARQSVKELL